MKEQEALPTIFHPYVNFNTATPETYRTLALSGEFFANNPGMVQGTRLEGNTFAQGGKVFLP